MRLVTTVQQIIGALSPIFYKTGTIYASDLIMHSRGKSLLLTTNEERCHVTFVCTLIVLANRCGIYAQWEITVLGLYLPVSKYLCVVCLTISATV